MNAKIRYLTSSSGENEIIDEMHHKRRSYNPGLKLFSLFVILLIGFNLLLTIVPQAQAAQISLAWDPNDPTPVDGYRVYKRTAGNDYNRDDPAWTGSQTTCTLTDIADGTDNYFVVTAVEGSLESADSNEVHFYAPSIYDLDESYSTTYGGTTGTDYIDYEQDTIHLAIPSALSDEEIINTLRDFAWAKDLTQTYRGQVVRVKFDARALNGYEDSPVFFRLEDELGISHSAERAVFVGSAWQSYTVDMVVMSDEPLTLKSYFSRLPGDFEFTRISTETIDPEVEPATFVYLKYLKRSLLGNRFTAVFGIELPLDSDGINYSVANNQYDIENDYEFAYGYLDPGVDEFEVEINASVALYNGANTFQGVFVRVTNIAGDNESAPFITAYLPGNSHDIADHGELLFCQLAVDDDDINYAKDGYYNRLDPAYRNTEEPGPYPASTNERVDIDNNTYSGYVQDWSFTRFMNAYYMRMKIWPEN